MEELIARIFGKLSEKKKEINNDINLNNDEKQKIIKSIDEKMKEILESRLIGYEALRTIYVNKNNGNLKEFDISESIEFKTAREIAEAVKRDATDDEIIQIIKSHMQTSEDIARFIIEKDIRNGFIYAETVFEMINEILPMEPNIIILDDCKCFKADIWAQRAEQILYDEILVNPEVFIEVMKTMPSVANNYINGYTNVGKL